MLQGIKSTPDIPSCWLKVHGLDIYYKRLGQGKPLIFLHGGANDWYEWHKNIPFFARRFTVYAPDLPGFGLSQTPDEPISAQSVAIFLKDFMDSLDLSAAHIIGHSMGGMMSIAMALEFPERIEKLVIIDSAGIGELSRKGTVILTIMKALRDLFSKNRNTKYREGRHFWDFKDRLREIRLPVMIIWGERDPYLSLSQAELAHSLI